MACDGIQLMAALSAGDRGLSIPAMLGNAPGSSAMIPSKPGIMPPARMAGTA